MKQMIAFFILSLAPVSFGFVENTAAADPIQAEKTLHETAKSNSAQSTDSLA